MKTTERRIYTYDIEVTTMSKQAPKPSIEDVLRAIEKQLKKQPVHISAKGNKACVIGGLEIDTHKRLARLFVRLGDKTLPEAVYSNPVDDKFRHLKKTEEEFVEVGAHVVISLDPEPNLPYHYLTLIEGVRSLSAYNIKALMNFILRASYSDDPNIFTYGDPSGGATQTPYLPLVELHGVMSEGFIEELQSGKLRSVSLIHNEVRTPLGSAPFLEKQTQELKLKVTNPSPPNVWAKLKSAFKHESQKYKRARISFEKEDKSSGTVYVNTETGSPEQIKYLKSTLIDGIDPPLAESAKTIVPHFVKRMELELLAQRL